MNEYGSEHILEWVMQLFVLNMDMIVDEMWFKLCAGCVVDNLGSPDIGETVAEISNEILAREKKLCFIYPL